MMNNARKWPKLKDKQFLRKRSSGGYVKQSYIQILEIKGDAVMADPFCRKKETKKKETTDVPKKHDQTNLSAFGDYAHVHKLLLIDEKVGNLWGLNTEELHSNYSCSELKYLKEEFEFYVT
jgi:hypothetical protein